MKSAMLTATILFSLPALAGGAPATPAPPAKDQPESVGQDPYTAFTRVAYGMVKNIILTGQ